MPRQRGQCLEDHCALMRSGHAMLMAKLAKRFRAVVGMFDSTLHKTIDEMTIAKDSPLITFVQLWECRLRELG
jgi:hypothetical protein